MMKNLKFKALLTKLGIYREVIKEWEDEEEYYEKLLLAHENTKMTESVKRAVENYKNNFRRVVERYGKEYLENLRNEVRVIKEYSIDHLDELVRITMENIEENMGYAYLAGDSGEAREIIGDIAKDSKIIVKAKSITSEEIFLREYLEELGIDVFETDLGEFLVQILGPKPMHLTSPALHIPREKVAETLSKLVNKEIDPNDIPRMVHLVRNLLREKFINAEVGISGANAIAADPGLVFTLENEGNIRIVSSLVDKFIVIAGIEKIVSSLYDAIKVLDLTMKYSGYKSVSYINITGGPSKTGDIEKKIIYGAHGPKEFHLILLDNGRSKAIKDPILKEALYCLRCGACLYTCPIFREYAGYWGGNVYMGGIGAIWTSITEGLKKAFPLPLSCLYCGNCKIQCPVKINQPKIIYTLVQRYSRGCS